MSADAFRTAARGTATADWIVDADEDEIIDANDLARRRPYLTSRRARSAPSSGPPSACWPS
jgi:hypothetical protein